jgi:hypothetical protein
VARDCSDLALAFQETAPALNFTFPEVAVTDRHVVMRRDLPGDQGWEYALFDAEPEPVGPLFQFQQRSCTRIGRDEQPIFAPRGASAPLLVAKATSDRIVAISASAKEQSLLFAPLNEPDAKPTVWSIGKRVQTKPCAFQHLCSDSSSSNLYLLETNYMASLDCEAMKMNYTFELHFAASCISTGRQSEFMIGSGRYTSACVVVGDVRRSQRTPVQRFGAQRMNSIGSLVANGSLIYSCSSTDGTVSVRSLFSCLYLCGG